MTVNLPAIVYDDDDDEIVFLQRNDYTEKLIDNCILYNIMVRRVSHSPMMK